VRIRVNWVSPSSVRCRASQCRSTRVNQRHPINHGPLDQLAGELHIQSHGGLVFVVLGHRCPFPARASAPASRITTSSTRSSGQTRSDWPMIGSADAPQAIYLGHGADQVGDPEIDEAEVVRWVPISEAQAMINRGEIIGAATIIGVMHAAAEPAAATPRSIPAGSRRCARSARSPRSAQSPAVTAAR
jgi:hypothetical protein